MHYADRHSQGSRRVSTDSRAKMVQSAASLIGSHGVSATSFSDVLSASGAPRGSIYHHFPDGKRQLAEDAIRFTSERVIAYQRGYTGGTAAGVLERFIGMWRSVVLGSHGAAGCVVAGVAIDTADDDELIEVVRHTFRSWIALLTEQLEATGVPAESAGSIATSTLAGMEGALILCRSEGDVAPLDAVAAELLRLLPPARKGNK
jgi:TetR/AcrR family transcriptional repressor of lmrAB and yxaGH operons